MFKMADQPGQGLLGLIAEMSKTTRIFQQGSTFCEGITFTQFNILDQLAKAGGRLSLAELHGHLEVEKSTTTRLVAPLVKSGLVAKERSKTDSRATVLRMTREGRETWDRVLLWLNGFLAAVSAALPPQDLAVVERAIKSFTQAMKEACASVFGRDQEG